MTDKKTKTLVMTAMMAAIIFIAIYMIKIPNPVTGGYSHMGDCMIFLAVLILGRKNGAIAAGLGGAMSDLLAGAAVWILPTMIIKFCMAFIMGTIIMKNPKDYKLQLVGAVTGGVFQIAGYTVAKIFLIGVTAAFASTPNICIQTTVGVVIFMLLSKVLEGTIEKLRGSEAVA